MLFHSAKGAQSPGWKYKKNQIKATSILIMFSFWTSASLTLKLWKFCHSVTYIYVSCLDISILIWLVSLYFFSFFGHIVWQWLILMNKVTHPVPPVPRPEKCLAIRPTKTRWHWARQHHTYTDQFLAPSQWICLLLILHHHHHHHHHHLAPYHHHHH